jgi:uncharacterized integral membrane protein (TIGR00698 family)
MELFSEAEVGNVTLRRSALPTWLPVLAVIGLVTAAGFATGHFVPLFGPAVMAILLGMLASTVWQPSRAFTHESARLGHLTLKVAIVLLGASVDLLYVARVAGGSLLVMLGTLAIGLFGIWQLGHLLGVQPRLRSLLTAGTTICGASAIAAVAPAVEAASLDVGYAISVVFLFNIAAVILFPAIGHLFHFSSQTFAIWAGTAVNDTSSVLAAGYAFGSGAAAYAAVVKLARTVMILPVTLGLALLAARWSEAGNGDGEIVEREKVAAVQAIRRSLPWFVVLFVVASAAYTVHLWPRAIARDAAHAAQIGTVIALAAIGLSTDVRHLVRAGHRPVLLGLFGWVLVAVTSLTLQGLTHLLGG